MKKRVLCYGDSNTWGLMPGTVERYDENSRWTAVCAHLLGDSYTILEDGINGRTTIFDQPWAQGRNGLKGLPYALQAQAPLDLIVIMLGTNDLSMAPLHQSAMGIEEIARTALHANSIFRVVAPVYRDIPRVLLIAPPAYHPVLDQNPENPNFGKRKESLQFSAICRQIAQKLGTQFLDAGEYAELSEIDGIHFTREDHQRLGQAVAKKISEIFQGETT